MRSTLPQLTSTPSGASGGAGWAMAFVECLMAEYRMELWYVVLALEVEVGAALIEARAARLAPGAGAGYVDRAVLDARAAKEAELRARFRIVDEEGRAA